MHPYEIDVEDRDLNLSSFSYSQKIKLRKFHWMQLRNRKTVAEKLRNLLHDFEFTTLTDVIDRTLEK